MNDSAGASVHRYSVAGVPIAAVSLNGVLDFLSESRWGESRSIHFCNTYSLSLVDGDPELLGALQRASMVVPDGWPPSLIGRLLRVPGHAGPVPGPDAFEAALKHETVADKRHVLFGATPEVLSELRRAIAGNYPQANVVGAYAPPFGGLATILADDCVKALIADQPDIVWVALGTPLQDKFLGAAAGEIPATMVSVGAAFDFMAQTMRRAPRPVRKLGLEWAWRLALEPRRLWRRYVVGSARFVASLVRCRPVRIPPGWVS